MDTNNYPPYTYPDSTTSSPRSRDLDYENPPQSSFDDQSFTKVKFMVSYGGKIQPRSHDNLLSYLGGDTKILSVDRNVKFISFYSKLASLVSPDTTPFTFKYQLPGEDLDALISVTNDDDLELMMQEFDRIMRGSIKISTARLRLFLFTDQQLSTGSASSETGVFSEPVRDVKFVDRCNSLPNAVVLDSPRVVSPSPTPPLPVPVPLPVHSNVDFLFGLDRVPVQVPGPVREPDMVQEMNRLQISAQEFHHLQMQNQQKQNAMYLSKNDDGFVDPYQKSSQMSAGYWQPAEHQNQPLQPPLQVQHHQQYNPQLQQQFQQPQHQQQLQQQQQFQPPQHQQQLQQQQQRQQQQQLLQQQQLQQQQQQQPVYMMHAPSQANAYHAQPMIRPNQGGYYPIQQQQQPMTSEQVYNTPAGAAQVVRQGENAYDNTTGRQVFYAPAQQGGIVAPPYPGMSAAAAVAVSGGGDMRRGSGDGKIGHKVTSSPAAV